jgi:NAD(P)-dependent dehydrogenase (short-subunit alcohol dehydrogenase family)
MSTTPMSKVWLITGSARGFGRRLAEAVLEHGDRLVATARHPDQLVETWFTDVEHGSVS